LDIVAVRKGTGGEMNCPICDINMDRLSDRDYGFHLADCQEKRIAELEKSAIVWHKYSDEKPQKTDHYLIHCLILNKRHFDFWHNDIQKRDRYDEYVIYWAYLPEPPEVDNDT
jgi:hypothetical protein